MQLTREQIESYRSDGYLILPNLFSTAELHRLREDVGPAMAEASARRVMEKDGRTVRGVHGQHTTFPAFDRLVRHPRLVSPVRQILEDAVYLYQFKINVKAGLAGDVWPWHQDFIFWQAEDGLAEPYLVNALVMLDDVDEFNGPVTFLVGSHAEGVIDPSVRSKESEGAPGEPGWAPDFSADLRYTVPAERLRALAARYRIASAKGSAGTVLLFHPNLAHCSANNLSPRDRRVAIITYNRVTNLPRAVARPRPDFMCSRDFTPIRAAADDALLA